MFSDDFELGDGVFAGCSVLSKVVLAPNIKILPLNTFSGCASLKEFDTGDTLEQIESNAFLNSGLRSLSLGLNVRKLGKGFTNGCANLEVINVNEGNQFFAAENNVLYDKSMERLIRYAPKIKDTQYAVKSSVKLISAGAFDYAYYLEEIDIGANVQEIEKGILTRTQKLAELKLPFIGGSRISDNYLAYLFGGEQASPIRGCEKLITVC